MSPVRKSPVVQCEIGPQAVQAIARRAAALAGLPEDAYALLPVERRHSFEHGTANVLGAMTALGWGLVPPESMPDDFAQQRVNGMPGPTIR